MRVIGRFEQQAIDRLWQQRTGLPLLVLMEHAAAAVVKRGREMVEAAATVLVLAGKGNNGGDAFASARLLAAAGYRVICRSFFRMRCALTRSKPTDRPILVWDMRSNR